LRVHIADTGLIFIECKRLGRLDGPKAKEEFDSAIAQLKSYIRAHIDQAAIKPTTVLGIVTDGNQWTLFGLDRQNEFHIIASWHFLSDDPRILAQRMWLLAKPALAQPTTAVVEYLARRTLGEVLKDNTKFLTRKVNERLPEGAVSEDLIGRWLREITSDSGQPIRHDPAEVEAGPTPAAASTASVSAEATRTPASDAATPEPPSRRINIGDLLAAGILHLQDVMVVDGNDDKTQSATLTKEGQINVGGQLFDTPSRAAVRALEMAGKQVKAINGWSAFRVLRAGVEIGTLLRLRDKLDDDGQGEHSEGQGPETADAETGGEELQEDTVRELKPLLGLLPEVTIQTSKSAVTFYIGKLAFGYAKPRKRGMPRLDVYVGDVCPDWCSPNATYGAWCEVEDWAENLAKTVELIRAAPRRRADDMAAGKDPYRRRATS
jgi:hypothetical protein